MTFIFAAPSNFVMPARTERVRSGGENRSRTRASDSPLGAGGCGQNNQ
jgi:hypothetical protein